MLDFGYYNMDCMQGMKEFPDKYFDLAIVDPPYGIGENGSKNYTRGKLAKAKNYKAFAGMDSTPPKRKLFCRIIQSIKKTNHMGSESFHK